MAPGQEASTYIFMESWRDIICISHLSRAMQSKVFSLYNTGRIRKIQL